MSAQSPAHVATVAKTNSDMLRGLMAASQIKDADAMADAYLKSHYEQCGFAQYAAR